MKETMQDIKCETLVCPGCGKSYGIKKQKDQTIKCRLCGYEGEKQCP